MSASGWFRVGAVGSALLLGSLLAVHPARAGAPSGVEDAPEPSPPTRPIVDALELQEPGPCLAAPDLAAAIGTWLQTERMDARLRVRVAYRDTPDPAVSFWVWRGDELIGERHLPAHDARCSDLSSALALAIALAIDATLLDPVPSAPLPAPPPPAPAGAPAPRSAEVRPPPPAPAPASDGAALWIGPGILAASGGYGPALTLGGGGALPLIGPLTLEGDLALTPLAARIETAMGSARIRTTSARLYALAAPWHHARLAVAFGVGAGPLFTEGRGASEATGTVVGRRDDTVVTAVVGRTRVLVRLGARLVLHVALDGGYTVPEVVVVDDRAAERPLFGPLLELDAGIGARLPRAFF